ncbi:hypothetical protein Moror_12373 [Moniliophthora roreri MCA 2997]|uniref:Uncharacterized protein n=2 Tax=Moniliophthora roreri TaxID=221103 RepID=V2XTL0_MONRO|nr:hypothetical protein Moror_12373 [Moniliophthora roreri MCA 2997]
MPSIAKSFVVVVLVGFNAVLAAPAIGPDSVTSNLDKLGMNPRVNVDQCTDNSGRSMLGVADLYRAKNMVPPGYTKDDVIACADKETDTDKANAIELCPDLAGVDACSVIPAILENCFTKGLNTVTLTVAPTVTPPSPPVDPTTDTTATESMSQASTGCTCSDGSLSEGDSGKRSAAESS